jgi:hypothetical protein
VGVLQPFVDVEVVVVIKCFVEVIIVILRRDTTNTEGHVNHHMLQTGDVIGAGET